MIGAEAALAACRFLHDAAALLVWGAAAYLAGLVPEALAEAIGRRLRPALSVAIAVAVATTLASLPITAATVGDGWGDALDPDTLGTLLFGTSVGTAWLLQAAAAGILAATWISTPRLRTTAAAAGLVVAALALSGHAVMHSGAVGLLHRLVDTVHVLAAGAWLGGLVPLALILAAAGRDCWGSTNLALRRFSSVGQVVVALVLLSGVANTALVLRRWPTDWSSPYQALLVAKVAAVAAMAALALANRYLIVPHMARDRPRALRLIRNAAIAEIALGLGAVGLVSVFGLLDPA